MASESRCNVVKNAITLCSFLLITFLFIYKLDYPYFFTDEILYVDAGREHLDGIYENHMQVALLTKYLAAFAYKVADHNVFLLRLPFAILGIFTAFLVYKILKKEFNYEWGLIGALLFSTSNIIYTSTRMVMTEPLMHFFWLLFLIYFYAALTENKSANYLWSGVFLGLSLGTKITSFILLPFTLIFIPYLLLSQKKKLSTVMRNYFYLYGFGLGVYVLTYVHSFLSIGEKTTIRRVYESTIDTYLNRNLEGKKHIVNDLVYAKSPSWTYLYHFYTQNGLLKLIVYTAGIVGNLLHKNLFLMYWGALFLLSFLFHQALGIKNVRYISTFELPLIILVTSGLYYISNKYGMAKRFVITLVLIIIVQRSVITITQPRTEYNALFENYLEPMTNNYSTEDKIYIYGSTRSSRWYKHKKGVGKDMFQISNNLDAHCPGFWEYNYIIIEKEELQRYGDNLLFEFVETNKELFEKSEMFGFYVYRKVSDQIPENVCVKKSLY